MQGQGQKRKKSVELKQSTNIKTILLVEDFDETRFMLKTSLEMIGYHVMEATNGIEAVEVAQRGHPDLILMDIGLPVMDGFAATRRIRAQSDLAAVPIVAVSAHATAEYRVKALSAGCNEYVTKPVDLVRLQNLIKRLID